MKLITTLALAAGIALGGIGMASAQELVNEIGGVTIEGNSKVNMFKPEKDQASAFLSDLWLCNLSGDIESLAKWLFW